MSDERVYKFDVQDFLPEDPREVTQAASGNLASVASNSAENRLTDATDAHVIAAAKAALQIDESDIPREMMWARLRQQRVRGAAGDESLRRPPGRGRTSIQKFAATVTAIAATLIIGIGIGRFTQSRTAETVAVSGPKDSASRAALRASDPAVIAMEEHFARTVSLLSTVRDENPDVGPTANVSGWARELLGTTRMLLDEPQLHDAHTRRLLQDLELVLIQIIQARGTAAPEAKRAPSETMRETNLLPRVRAAVTAAVATDPSYLTGEIE